MLMEFGPREGGAEARDGRIAAEEAGRAAELARAFAKAKAGPARPARRGPGRRLAGLVAGLGAAALGLAVVVGEQLAPVSANAVVNAQVTALRAPIAGEVRLEPRRIGARVAEGELLGTLVNPRVESRRLDDLILERATTEAEIARLEARARAVAAARAEMERRAAAYARAETARLEARIARAEAERRAARARLAEAEAAAGRGRMLASQGLMPEAEREPLEAGLVAAEAELDRADAEARRARLAGAAAAEGVFLEEGADDLPFSARQAARLALSAEEIAADLAHERRRLAAVAARLDLERLRVGTARAARVSANAEGLLWEIVASDGEAVVPGQELLRLVDCRTTMVTLSVTEQIYNGLQIGDPARFRLEGGARVYEGTVARLAGSGARGVYGSLAIAPSAKHLERFDVTLLVPDLRDDRDAGCAIGRTGRAFFGARPLDWLRERL